MAKNPQANEMYEALREQTQHYFRTIVFGSYARNEAYSSSDIDVLIIDESFSGWNVDVPASDLSINWDSSFQELHLLTCSKTEFESRFFDENTVVQVICEEGFALNTSFGLTDYVSDLKKEQQFS
jgi:predicted nucleotidyltransferase